MAKALAILVLGGGVAGLLAVPAGPVTRGVPRPVSAPDGRLVLAVLSPERAIVADPRSGRTRERRLAGGTLCHGPVLGIGDRVVLGGARGTTPVVLSLPLSLRGAGRSLGHAGSFAAAGADRVVLIRRTPRHGAIRSADVDRGGGPAARIRSVDVDGGGGPAARMPLPRWGAVEAVVGDHLLVSDDLELTLRRPGGGPPRAIGRGWAVATGGSRVAWCPPGCRSLWLWSADRATRLDPPPGTRIDEGPDAAFAPDGRLAVPLRTAHGVRVGVVDLGTRRWSVVPRSRLGSYRAIAWSPSGRWLYFAGRGERLLGWRVGAERPIRLPVRTGGTVMSIATVRGARPEPRH